MPTYHAASAIAHPNIALIKYWGDVDAELHIPANGSISMNLAELSTRTTVRFEAGNTHDTLLINGTAVDGDPLQRVVKFLERVRRLSGMAHFATVESWNNFPLSAGIASSASAFAALSLAASKAAGMDLEESALSRLARLGSGSACRSVPAAFVEWQAGENDLDSYAYSIAGVDHWDLCDCIAIVSREGKPASSSYGHSLAATSLLQPARLADAPRRLDICRQAVIKRDFETLAEVVELDSSLMHAVMCTSHPPLMYWQPATVTVIQAIKEWQKAGIPVCYTIDAGPNVHALCLPSSRETIAGHLKDLPGVLEVIASGPGGGAVLL